MVPNSRAGIGIYPSNSTCNGPMPSGHKKNSVTYDLKSLAQRGMRRTRVYDLGMT